MLVDEDDVLFVEVCVPLEVSVPLVVLEDELLVLEEVSVPLVLDDGEQLSPVVLDVELSVPVEEVLFVPLVLLVLVSVDELVEDELSLPLLVDVELPVPVVVDVELELLVALVLFVVLLVPDDVELLVSLALVLEEELSVPLVELEDGQSAAPGVGCHA